jgi:hypothetical protein
MICFFKNFIIIFFCRNIKDCTELGETVKALQERNYALEKIIREMMQELATVIEVKVSSDYQFNKFK